MTAYALVYLACVVGASEVSQCSMGVAPYWFESLEHCEEEGFETYKDFLSVKSMEDVDSECVPITLPLVPKGDKL